MLFVRGALLLTFNSLIVLCGCTYSNKANNRIGHATDDVMTTEEDVAIQREKLVQEMVSTGKILKGKTRLADIVKIFGENNPDLYVAGPSVTGRSVFYYFHPVIHHPGPGPDDTAMTPSAVITGRYVMFTLDISDLLVSFEYMEKK